MNKQTIAWTPDYQTTVSSDEIWETSDATSNFLAPLLPDEADLVAEFRRELRSLSPGIKLVGPLLGRYASVDDVTYKRTKAYARVILGHERVFAKDVDHVRGTCLEAARVLARHVATQLPPGPAMLWAHAKCPAYQRRYDQEHILAAMCPEYDALQIRMCAYYAATPQPAKETP